MCFLKGKGPIKKRHFYVGNSCVFDVQPCSKTSVVEKTHNKDALTIPNVLDQNRRLRTTHAANTLYQEPTVRHAAQTNLRR